MRWSPEDIATMAELAEQGISARVAAERMGRDATTARWAARRYGVHFHSLAKTPDERIRKRWRAILPKLKADLRRDLDAISA